MKIYSVMSREFVSYGRILVGQDTQALLERLDRITDLTQETVYKSSEQALECMPDADRLRDYVFGGLPIQLGWCNGKNTKLNCLEYHCSSEVNIGIQEFILLVARRDQIENGILDTAKVKAFRVPAGIAVELYATTLHYAPCRTKDNEGFKVLIALPRGTNNVRPRGLSSKDECKLWACNKWLLAHAESSEAAQGAYVGLCGENIDLARC